MEKTNKNSGTDISLKDIINWIIAIASILASLVSANFFAASDVNAFLKVLFISLIISFSIIFIWIKLFSDKKLTGRLLKEVETRKDLERQKEKLEKSLKWSQTFCSHEEKNKLEKENKKLENKFWQLRSVLSWCRVSEEEAGIDENISLHEWQKNPEIQRKIEEIINKPREEKWELEEEILNLRVQLKNNGVLWYNQHISDKRLRKEVINEVEGYWKYTRGDKNYKIKGKTIEKFLGNHWKENFENKEGKEIIEEWKRLISLIDELANSTK